jgi:hypothetical protein
VEISVPQTSNRHSLGKFVNIAWETCAHFVEACAQVGVVRAATATFPKRRNKFHRTHVRKTSMVTRSSSVFPRIHSRHHNNKVPIRILEKSLEMKM